MADFYEVYVRAACLLLVVLAVAIGCIGVGRARLSPLRFGLFLTTAVLLFGSWYAAAIPLSQAGHFNVPATPSDPPIVLMFLFGGSFLLFALAWWTPLGRILTEATPLAVIAAFQIPRVIGGVFLIGWLAGDLPALFAIPAGMGDVLAGIAGWQASRALAKNRPEAQRLLMRATWIGIADFALAVVLGIVTSAGFAHLFAREAPNIINDYPLAMFPAYIVPIFLGFHLIAIARVRQEHSRRMTAAI
ncbi:hypothetical protein [Sulfitobacter sp. JB4-11]|uniref:hypothetical protein n=1 Tax=Sulfitobacter rhodophyticola TaxID=3238304 RepID=UPI003519A627